jgi:hypothetical protein
LNDGPAMLHNGDLQLLEFDLSLFYAPGDRKAEHY